MGPVCPHCRKAPSTSDHAKWECEALEHVRVEADPLLASLPRKYLPSSVRCGIALAMKTDGLATFWGRQIDNDLDERLQRLVGVNKQLTIPGSNADITEARQAALAIPDEPQRAMKNARQTMLMQARTWYR